MEFRPDRKAAYTSFAITFAVLGAVFFLGRANPRLEPVYSARWHEHSSYYASCADCHKPFQKVQDISCFKCHTEYSEDFDIASLAVYEPEWDPMEDIPKRKKRAADRNLHAQLMYHDLDVIRAESCTSCHLEHMPPPPPDGWAFHHRHTNMLPRTVNIDNCRQCHSPNQAPPDNFHAALSGADAMRNCGDCHKSTAAWRDLVVLTLASANAPAAQPASPARQEPPRESALPARSAPPPVDKGVH